MLAFSISTSGSGRLGPLADDSAPRGSAPRGRVAAPRPLCAADAPRAHAPSWPPGASTRRARDDPAALEAQDPVDRARASRLRLGGADERDLIRAPDRADVELDSGGAVEAARRLVEQQHRWRERDAARDEHAALLAARELEEPTRREERDAELAHRCERELAFARLGLPARHVGAIDARQHDVERGEIPVQPRVPILELVAHDDDLARAATASVLGAAAEVVVALAALRRGPDRPREQTEERGLAAAVRADDAPALAALEPPRDSAQHAGRPRCRRRLDRATINGAGFMRSIGSGVTRRARVYLS